MADDRLNRIRKVDRRENLSANAGVLLHFRKFCRCELPGLIENVFRDRQFAQIVEQGRRFHRTQIALLFDAELGSKPHRLPLYTANMAVCHLVFGVDDMRECLDRREVHPVHLLEVRELVLDSTYDTLEGHIQDERNGGDERQDDGVSAAGLDERDQ